MSRTAAFATAALLASVAAPVLAQPVSEPSRFAVGIGGGTLGGSVFGNLLVEPRFVVHGQGSFLNFDQDFSSASANYKGAFKSNVGLATAEFHPIANPLFIGAGAVFGERRVDVTGTPSSAATIRLNGVTYTAAQLVSVKGTADYGGAAPVVDIGWDNSLHGARQIGFRVWAGALIASDPKVALTASGPLASDPSVQSNLRAEEASLRSDAKDFNVYPVVEAGLTYRF